jgi:hypothetical protein
MTFTIHLWDFDLDSDTLGPIRCRHLNAEKKFAEFEDGIRAGTVDSTALARNVFQAVARKRTGDVAIDAKCGGDKFSDEEVSALSVDELDQFCGKLLNGRFRLLATAAGDPPPPAVPVFPSGREGLAPALMHFAETNRAATKRTLETAQRGYRVVLDVEKAFGGKAAILAMQDMQRTENMVKAALGSVDLKTTLADNFAKKSLEDAQRYDHILRATGGIVDHMKSLLDRTSMGAVAQAVAGIGPSEDILRGLQITDQVSRRQDIENLFGGDMAVSLATAEKARLRQLVDNAIGVDRFTAATQANTLAQLYTDQLRETAHERFLLLGHAEAERMSDLMRGNYFGSVLDRYSNQLPRAQEAMLGMQAPWLDSLHALESVRGFAELQAIGGALTIVPSFGDDFSGLLRADLGDWRDRITDWSDGIGESVAARHSLYVERGLNTDLTDFPEDAFDESLALAGISGNQSVLVVEYGQLTSLFIDGEEDKALARTNVAHDHLQRFEFQLRKFIDQSLSKAVGTNWPKQRLPNGLYDKWHFKKSNDKGQGVNWPLITYADFTEYVDIICRSDNWKEVFEPIFKRKEGVRESFQRMYAIRIAIAHARPITNADALYLYVEVKRLLDALPLVT